MPFYEIAGMKRKHSSVNPAITAKTVTGEFMKAGVVTKPAGYTPDVKRNVDFLTSYPPGDIVFGQLWGPMREETNAWFARVHTGLATPHATAEDGHRNLLLTMAMDLSAKRRKPVALPADLDAYGELP